jgi:hypothetical protein
VFGSAADHGFSRQQGLQIVYEPGHKITLLRLEKLHPFDSCKFSKVKVQVYAAAAAAAAAAEACKCAPSCGEIRAAARPQSVKQTAQLSSNPNKAAAAQLCGTPETAQ